MAEYRYGFIDKTGRFVIEPQYEEVGDFHEGLAWTKLGGKFKYIDKYGKTVLEPDEKCISVGSFHEGLANIYINRSRMEIIDKTGRQVGPWFEWVSDFRGFQEGIACLKTRENKYGFIDKTGNFVIVPQFGYALDFHDGLAGVTLDPLTLVGNQKWGYINKRGDFVIKPMFKDRGLFSEGLAAARFGVGEKMSPDDRYGAIDKTGEIIIEPQYRFLDNFHDGLAYAHDGVRKGFINKAGHFVFTVDQNMDLLPFREGLAQVRSGDKMGFIDKAGQLIINPVFEEAYPFHEGLSCVCIGGKYGFINKMGEYIIDPLYNGESVFHEGLACVKVERKIQHTVIESPSSVSRQTTQKTYSSSSKPKTNSGCYIATAVYGSYDCPEVWTLRRYRDNVLDNKWYGRAFIRTYYSISPILVKWIGKADWFRNLFCGPLNKLVAKLNKRGFDDSPYHDKY